MRVLQVSTSDDRGGAAMVASSLHAEYRSRGLTTSVAVGTKRSTDPDTYVIPNDRSRDPWARMWNAGAEFAGRALSFIRGGDRVAGLMRDIGSPGTAVARRIGSEIFNFPGTWQLLNLTPETPDVLHLHNLHGGYFDLRALPWLTERIPTVLTLHDAWMISGHCAHSFDCGRWETGCGSCPDLSIPPAIPRDNTSANWKRKRQIYSESRLYIVAPSAWLLRKVQHSMLAPAALEQLVIPNGVDLEVFKPGSKAEARARLGIPVGARVLLFAANGIRNNPWKDFRSLRRAVSVVAEGGKNPNLIFLGLGESGSAESIGDATIRFEPFRDDRSVVADYYRAADVYVHAAKVDTFPNTILEALACGTPVVATGVGGIPEQIRSLNDSAFPFWLPGASTLNDATGILVEPGDGDALGRAAGFLLDDFDIRMKLGSNAAHDAANRFSLKAQADSYLSLYARMIRESVS